MADAEELVDAVLAAGEEHDAVAALAEPFPLRVFPDAVGLPAGRPRAPAALRRPRLQRVRPGQRPRREGRAAGRRAVRVGELPLRAARCCPTRGSARRSGPPPTAATSPRHRRRSSSARCSPPASTPPCTASSAVLYAFATNPEQWQRLRADPSLARVAFDEAVRWESPVQTFFRTANRDIDIDGTVVPDGQKILLFLAAANRDPRRWTDPDAFDLSRDPSGHVGFGFGIHQCVGQHVARLEAEALLTALAARVERIELAGPTRRHHNNTLRAWASIPLRLTRG